MAKSEYGGGKPVPKNASDAELLRFLKDKLYIQSKGLKYKGALLKYRTKHADTWKIVNGKRVRWDSRTNKPYDPKVAAAAVNKDLYGTETPKKDVKYLEEKVRIDSREELGIDPISKAFSKKSATGGTIAEDELALKIESDRKKLKDTLFIGTSFERKAQEEEKLDQEELDKYEPYKDEYGITRYREKRAPLTSSDLEEIGSYTDKSRHQDIFGEQPETTSSDQIKTIEGLMIGKESTEGNISGDQAVMTAKPTETTVVDPSKMPGGPGDVWRRGNEKGLTLKQANEQTRNWMLASGWDVSKIPAHERDDVFADVRMNRLNNPKVNDKEFLHVGGGVVLEKQDKPIVYKPKKKKKKKS